MGRDRLTFAIIILGFGVFAGTTTYSILALEHFIFGLRHPISVLAPSPRRTPSSIPPTPRATVIREDRDDWVCTIPGGIETNITNPSHPLVAESRDIVLSFGVSQRYFAEHFQFLCAVADDLNDRRVRWQYSIGEFTAIIEDGIGFGGGGSYNIHSIKDDLYGLTEIEKVISKAEADRRMRSCIGEFKEARVAFVFPKGFDRETSRARPYLTARSIKEERGLDIWWEIGNVDLQTGECIKDKGGIIHAPGP